MARRISGRRERLKQILTILDKKKSNFEALLVELKCGRKTLSDDLKILVRQGIIKKTEDQVDARRKWYEKIVVGPDDRVKAEKGKYAAIDFIEGMQNPVYAFKSSDNGKQTISAFISPAEEHLRGKGQKELNKMVNMVLPAFALRTGKLFLKPGSRMAYVMTLEG